MTALTTLAVVVTAGQKVATRPLRIATDGRYTVAWKGSARPVTVTGHNAVTLDLASEKLPLDQTRAAKMADLGLATKAESVAIAPAADERTAEERMAALHKGLRLQEAKAAKNPGDDKTAKAVETTRGKIAALHAEIGAAPAPKAAAPQAAVSVDDVAALAQSSGLDILALIQALSTRL